MKLEKIIDYNNRFKAEYYPLSIRINSSEIMLEKNKNNQLDFVNKHLYELLNSQLELIEDIFEQLQDEEE